MALDNDDGVVLADSSDVLVVRRHMGCHVYSLLTHVVGAAGQRAATATAAQDTAVHTHL